MRFEDLNWTDVENYLKADWYSWWVAPSVLKVAADSGLRPTHANWLEAFSFCRVADLPDGVKPPITPARTILNADETRATYGDGVFGGGPYLADDAVMQKMFDAAVADIVQKLRFE